MSRLGRAFSLIFEPVGRGYKRWLVVGFWIVLSASNPTFTPKSQPRDFPVRTRTPLYGRLSQIFHRKASAWSVRTARRLPSTQVLTYAIEAIKIQRGITLSLPEGLILCLSDLSWGSSTLLSASIVTSTSAPSFRLTALPAASCSVFSIRISRYKSSALSTAICGFSGSLVPTKGLFLQPFQAT